MKSFWRHYDAILVITIFLATFLLQESVSLFCIFCFIQTNNITTLLQVTGYGETWKTQFNNSIPTCIYLLKVNSRKTKTRYEICSKLTIKIQEWCPCCRSGVFTVNFEHTSQLVPVFLLLALNRQMKWQKQWHSKKMGRWLHSECFLIIVPDYHIQGKRLNYFYKLTVIFYLSYMHSIIRNTLNSKNSSVSWFKNISSWS